VRCQSALSGIFERVGGEDYGWCPPGEKERGRVCNGERGKEGCAVSRGGIRRQVRDQPTGREKTSEELKHKTGIRP